jgi:hypothetical protein
MKAFVSRENGVQITFSNKITVSVVFGKYTFSDEGKTTCEVAVIDNHEWLIRNDDGEWIRIPKYAEVMSRVTADELAVIINEVSNI